MNVSRSGCEAPEAALDESVDREFDVLSFDVDAEAKSDSVTSVHAWKERVERERLETEIEHLRARHESRRADIALRGKYAKQALGLATLAVWFWALMFAATSIANAMMGRQPLSDNALLTLTGGATVNVIAVCLVVVRGLFPAKSTSRRRVERDLERSGIG